MCGSFGRYRRVAMPVASVPMPTLSTNRLVFGSSAAKRETVCTKDALGSAETPKKFFSWLVAISTAAPAVKPITTLCEMKLTRKPRRAMPIASIIRPVMKVRVKTSWM